MIKLKNIWVSIVDNRNELLFLNRRGGSLKLIHANEKSMQNRFIEIDNLDYFCAVLLFTDI